MEAYQISETGSALTKTHLIKPTTDPHLMRISEPTEQLYVPEIFYSEKNAYNVTVKKSAKPTFPTDYLLVNVTHGFPVVENPLFKTNEYPIENRNQKHEDATIAKHLKLLNCQSDFHFLYSLWKLQKLGEVIILFINKGRFYFIGGCRQNF